MKRIEKPGAIATGKILFRDYYPGNNVQLINLHSHAIKSLKPIEIITFGFNIDYRTSFHILVVLLTNYCVILKVNVI